MNSSRCKVVPIRESVDDLVTVSQVAGLRLTEDAITRFRAIGLNDYAEKLDVIRADQTAEMALRMRKKPSGQAYRHARIFA